MSKHISGRGIYDLVAKDQNIIGLEIGVDVGDTADFMLEMLPMLTLHGIDPYLGYIDWNGSDLNQKQRNWCEETANQVLLQYGERYILHKDTSDNLVDSFEDGMFDYIFIDGLHTYEQVLLDCQNYYAKLKSGGVFAGHDYRAIAGVRKAADEFAASVGATILETEIDVWYWIKP